MDAWKVKGQFACPECNSIVGRRDTLKLHVMKKHRWSKTKSETLKTITAIGSLVFKPKDSDENTKIVKESPETIAATGSLFTKPKDSEENCLIVKHIINSIIAQTIIECIPPFVKRNVDQHLEVLVHPPCRA
jgi:hypothetical protein